jgi:hypothetical protein
MEVAMPKVTALTIDDSGFLALPQEALDRLRFSIGGELVLAETERGYRVAKFEPQKPADGKAS